MLSKVSERCLLDERRINERLFELLDARESFVFEAGAGSGKTYSLVECLRHIARANGATLRARGQKIACITYTNVAAEEVRSRLGASDVVESSTIHGFLWPRMAPFQTELVSIHREMLANEITCMEEDLLTNEKSKVYSSLSAVDRELFAKTITEHKQVFYSAYDLRSKDFKEAMKPVMVGIPLADGLMKNVEHFKGIATKCIRISNYTSCVANIDRRAEGFTSVEYDPQTSVDRLTRMTFSHDTLLVYAKRLIETSRVFRRMLMDSFPFVLVDEYQDTSEFVISLLERIREESKQLGRDFVTGYFGDHAQSIYDRGIGSHLQEQTSGLATVTKPYNRRSSREIIDAGNRIRGGDIVQESVFEDDAGGTVELYVSRGGKSLSDETMSSFVNRTALELNATELNPLHCLVLTNRRVANMVGFGLLFQQMKDMPYFKRYYKTVGTEFASTDPGKMNKACKLLFDICLMRHRLTWDTTTLGELGIGLGAVPIHLTIRVVRRTIEALRAVEATTFGEYLEELERVANCRDDSALASCARYIIVGSVGKEVLSRESTTAFLIKELCPDASEATIADDRNKVEKLLGVSLIEYDAWCRYVQGEGAGIVHYHTYHGSKGTEYDSVLIVVENSFRTYRYGKGDNLIKTFFESYHQVIKDEKERDKVGEARNLLYVATTRAVRHLRVLYMDDISSFRKGIERVYGPAMIVDEIVDP